MAIGETPPVKSRPVYLNLPQIRQPIPAIVSILHRISGAGCSSSASRSCSGAAGDPRLAGRIARRCWFGRPLVKLVVLGFVWAYLHHLFAGIRHLFLDVHIGDSI